MSHATHPETAEERPRYTNTSLLAALETILSDHASGILTSARVGENHCKLHLVAGEVVDASSLVPEERLLSRLRAHGRLTETQHREALTALEASGERAGRWAIDHAQIPEEAVVEALAEQIRDALAALLTDPHHPVRFLPVPKLELVLPHPRIPITEAISTTLLTLPMEALRARFPLDDADTFRAAVTPWPLAHRFAFDEAAATVLGLVEPGRPLSEIARLADLDPDGVRRRLFLLTYLGLVAPDLAPATAGQVEGTGSAERAPGAHEQEVASEATVTSASETAQTPLSEEAQAVAAELRGLERRIDSMDPFSLLRVNRNHPLAEVKRSYRSLSRRLHPDVVRGLGLPEELVQVADRVTQAMTAAYQTLSDPKRRAAHLEKSSPAVRPTASDPETIFANAKAAITTREYERAVRLLQNLIDRKPDQAEYHLYLAAACVQLRGRKREAEQALKQATRLAPSDPHAYVALGDLYREGGMEEKAASCYREALRWDPRHRHAKRALEAIEAAAHRHEGGLGGLLGRFRKG